MGNKPSQLLSSVRKSKYAVSSLEDTQRAGSKRSAEEMSSANREEMDVEHCPERFVKSMLYALKLCSKLNLKNLMQRFTGCFACVLLQKACYYEFLSREGRLLIA